MSCNARKSAVDIQVENKKEQTSISTTDKIIVSTDLTKESITEIKTETQLSEEIKESKISNKSNEQLENKNISESSAKTIKHTEYFENGTKKSETEYSENFAKVESENRNLKSQITTQSETITNLKSANISLQRISDNQKLTIKAEQNKNAKYQSEISDYKKSKTKETEKEDYPWYWIVIGTILIWELLRFGLKKAFPQFNLFKKFNL